MWPCRVSINYDCGSGYRLPGYQHLASTEPAFCHHYLIRNPIYSAPRSTRAGIPHCISVRHAEDACQWQCREYNIQRRLLQRPSLYVVCRKLRLWHHSHLLIRHVNKLYPPEIGMPVKHCLHVLPQYISVYRVFVSSLQVIINKVNVHQVSFQPLTQHVEQCCREIKQLVAAVRVSGANVKARFNCR